MINIERCFDYIFCVVILTWEIYNVMRPHHSFKHVFVFAICASGCMSTCLLFICPWAHAAMWCVFLLSILKVVCGTWTHNIIVTWADLNAWWDSVISSCLLTNSVELFPTWAFLFHYAYTHSQQFPTMSHFDWYTFTSLVGQTTVSLRMELFSSTSSSEFALSTRTLTVVLCWCTAVLGWAGLEPSLYWTACYRESRLKRTSTFLSLSLDSELRESSWSRHR